MRGILVIRNGRRIMAALFIEELCCKDLIIQIHLTSNAVKLHEEKSEDFRRKREGNHNLDVSKVEMMFS